MANQKGPFQLERGGRPIPSSKGFSHQKAFFFFGKPGLGGLEVLQRLRIGRY